MWILETFYFACQNKLIMKIYKIIQSYFIHIITINHNFTAIKWILLVEWIHVYRFLVRNQICVHAKYHWNLVFQLKFLVNAISTKKLPIWIVIFICKHVFTQSNFLNKWCHHWIKHVINLGGLQKIQTFVGR